MEKREKNGDKEWDFKSFWQYISKLYLFGEHYLQNYAANRLIKKYPNEITKDIKKIYLFTEDYARSNLYTPIYLETVKECCEYIDKFIRSKRLYEKKEIQKQFLNKMGNVWSTCIHLKNGQNYHIEENLKGQREIWIEKIAEIFKELNKRDLNKFRNLILDKSKFKN
uniref:Uncharacterized protein n=1 Tax=Meloidogyne enterolobii TaxID=390850 RepID=A0A6V7U287_MELEN|nr:unnamed protein product [Meloidogyne enterolobii]